MPINSPVREGVGAGGGGRKSATSAGGKGGRVEGRYPELSGWRDPAKAGSRPRTVVRRGEEKSKKSKKSEGARGESLIRPVPSRDLSRDFDVGPFYGIAAILIWRRFYWRVYSQFTLTTPNCHFIFICRRAGVQAENHHRAIEPSRMASDIS